MLSLLECNFSLQGENVFLLSPYPGGSFLKGLGGGSGGGTLEENFVILFILCADREDIVCSL